ncbi:MAG: SDR family NAD(P)-dependent oxidoreductase, partial [Desulfobacterales bacterium]
MEIKEPVIQKEDILILNDDNFTADHVCIVTGAGTGIGRATAVAAAANKLMTVGLDINGEEGKKTQKMARDMGGQMIFIKTDLTSDADIEHAIIE